MVRTQIFELGNNRAETTSGPEFGMSIKQTRTVTDTFAVSVFETEEEFREIITDPSRFRLTINDNAGNAEKVCDRLIKNYVRKGEPFSVSSFPTKYMAQYQSGLTYIFICISTIKHHPSSLVISKLAGRYLRILSAAGNKISRVDIEVIQQMLIKFCEEKEFLYQMDEWWKKNYKKTNC